MEGPRIVPCAADRTALERIAARDPARAARRARIVLVAVRPSITGIRISINIAS